MPVTLILLPGLSASRAVFAPQLRHFPDLIAPDWPAPISGESLAGYAERFAASLMRYQPCILGGMSFGGMLAQEMARHLHPLGLVLIATIRGPDQLPRYAKFGRAVRGLIPWLPIRLLQSLTGVFEWPGIRSWFPVRRILAEQFRIADPNLFRWSLEQILLWPVAPEVSCPVWQIHGDSDPVLPASLTTPDRLIAGGGHVLSLTHPVEVNQFLGECLNACSQ